MEETLILTALPEISFAHIFNTEKDYINFLPKRENSFEIVYLKSGKAVWSINKNDYEISNKKIFILPHSHDIQAASLGGNEHHSIGICVPFQLKSSELFAYIDGDTPSAANIKEKIDNLILLFNSDSTRKQKLYSLIFELVDLINESLEKESGLKEESSGKIIYVNKIKKYIAQNIATEITLTQLSEALHLSVPYLCTIFKKLTKETIITYINKQKLIQLKNLIAHYNFSLKEACSLTGIKDPSYASRLFRKHEKLSVREFKLSLRNKI